MRNKLARLNVSKALNTNDVKQLDSMIGAIVKDNVFTQCNALVEFIAELIAETNQLDDLFMGIDTESTIENALFNMCDDDIREILINECDDCELAEILGVGNIYENEWLVERLENCIDLARKLQYSSFFDESQFLENYCDDIEYKEPLEFWIVSNWLADKLEQHGECVDKDLKGLCVWGRCTSGQSISIDSVIIEIAKEVIL